MSISQSALRKWGFVHKWTSLITTVFLLLLCITGLPLIFHEEINALTRPHLAVQRPANPVSYDQIMLRAMATQPGSVPLYLSWNEEHSIAYATIGPSTNASERQMKTIAFDVHTGELIDGASSGKGVMDFIFDLHANLLLGLPGELFLSLIGLIFVAAVVSGVVVYAPFMRRLAFGTVRKDRSKRIKWLDTHNMIGIITLGWVMVVGLTGIILTLNTPITLIWQRDQLAEISAPYKYATPVEHPVTINTVLETIHSSVPDADISFIAWPGVQFSTPYHFLVALRGDTPLTKRLVKIAMINGQKGVLTDLRDTPWYIKAVFLSGPLHFGDYGGFTLKVIWALLDIAMIIILITGLYLWLGRRRSSFERRMVEFTNDTVDAST